MEGFVEFGRFLHLEFDSYTAQQFGQRDQPDILVVHYAGHGALVRGIGPVIEHDLIMQPLPRARAMESLRFQMFLGFLRDWAEDRDNLHMLIVLDCCYAGITVPRMADSSIEVVYATGATTITSGRSRESVSFTHRFLGALRGIHAQYPSKPHVDPVEILADLQEKGGAKTSGHGVLQGGSRLSLYFKQRRLPTLTETPERPQRMAKVVLSIHMAEDPESATAQQVLSCLRKLATTVAEIELLSIDRAQSTMILLRANATWGLRVCNLSGTQMDIKCLGWSFQDYNLNWSSAVAGAQIHSASRSESLENAAEGRDLVESDDCASSVSESSVVEGSSPPTSPMPRSSLKD